TGLEGTVQLTAAGDIKAGTLFGHQAAEVQVGVGLDAIADEWLDRSKGPLQLAEVVPQRAGAVNIQRRAVGLGQSADGDVLAVENPIPIVEMIHVRTGPVSRWFAEPPLHC